MLKDKKMRGVVVLLGIAESVNLSEDLCFRRELLTLSLARTGNFHYNERHYVESTGDLRLLFTAHRIAENLKIDK